ncbi:MAG TPA: hypothetical protein V6D14_24040 [Coleofasciculaceae cyanobacterium]
MAQGFRQTVASRRLEMQAGFGKITGLRMSARLEVAGKPIFGA